MNFLGKSILITGASQGLGKALALNLAEQGARLTLIARNQRNLNKVVHEIRASGGSAFGISADIADKRAIYPMAAQAAEVSGPVDVLINNASTLGPLPMPLLIDTECEDFSHVLETNLLAPFRLIKAIAGSMILRKDGLILNISSDAAIHAYPNWGAYGASKTALDHLTRIWAGELDGTGVRFFSIDPGEMDTQMHADALPDADRSLLKLPNQVAQEIIEKLSHQESLQNGARLVLGESL